MSNLAPYELKEDLTFVIFYIGKLMMSFNFKTYLNLNKSTVFNGSHHHALEASIYHPVTGGAPIGLELPVDLSVPMTA